MIKLTLDREGESVDFFNLFNETLSNESSELGNWSPFFFNGSSLGSLTVSSSSETYEEIDELSNKERKYLYHLCHRGRLLSYHHLL